MADVHDGRVRIHRIGSDLIECDLSRSLMRALLDRGDIVRGARKVWRYTSEEIGTIAAALLKPLSEAERVRSRPRVLASLAAISEVNLCAWTASFGMDRADVDDLSLTAMKIDALVDRMPIDAGRAAALLEGMRPNLGGPATDPKVRAALTSCSDLRVRLAALSSPAPSTRVEAVATQRLVATSMA
ncbi:MAG: hypothetical protein BGP25_05125 [Lysobacterales bacterium 63-13]|nr:MAG: hypothetical protein BGP25_05125 [Xanthomonadales bacterium 63-13]